MQGSSAGSWEAVREAVKKCSSSGRTDLAIHFQPSWPTTSECFSLEAVQGRVQGSSAGCRDAFFFAKQYFNEMFFFSQKNNIIII